MTIAGSITHAPPYRVVKVNMNGKKNVKLLEINNGRDFIDSSLLYVNIRNSRDKEREIRNGFLIKSWSMLETIGSRGENFVYYANYDSLNSHQNVKLDEHTASELTKLLRKASDRDSDINLGDFKFLFKYMVLNDHDYYYGLRYDFETDKVKLIPFNTDTLRCDWKAPHSNRCHLLYLYKDSRKLTTMSPDGDIFNNIVVLKNN